MFAAQEDNEEQKEGGPDEKLRILFAKNGGINKNNGAAASDRTVSSVITETLLDPTLFQSVRPIHPVLRLSRLHGGRRPENFTS